MVGPDRHGKLARCRLIGAFCLHFGAGLGRRGRLSADSQCFGVSNLLLHYSILVYFSALHLKTELIG